MGQYVTATHFAISPRERYSILCVKWSPTRGQKQLKILNNHLLTWSLTGGGRLREVVAYERFHLWWFDLKTFGILEKWSLMGGGRFREVVAKGGSTVALVPLFLKPHPFFKNNSDVVVLIYGYYNDKARQTLHLLWLQHVVFQICYEQTIVFSIF